MMHKISEKYAERRKEKTEIYHKVFYEQEDATHQMQDANYINHFEIKNITKERRKTK